MNRERRAIVVPLDGSPLAEAALPVAVEMGKPAKVLRAARTTVVLVRAGHSSDVLET